MSTSPSIHFTYRQPTDPHLQQGDLLRRTPELEKVLQEVHPHYARTPSYCNFLVLTQSCDLVRRESTGAKAKYLTLCGVRPAQLAIERELDAHQTPFERLAGVCGLKKKNAIRDFVTKLLNNNATNYFYLHEEPLLDIHEPLCAFLPLSIALRTHQWYSTCLAARTASLKEVFQAKLGWLVGNLYSRVGTPDWVPEVEPERIFKERLATMVDSICTWRDERQIEAAVKASASQMPSTRADALRVLDAAEVKSRRKRIEDAIEASLADVELLGDRALGDRDIRRVMAAIRSDPHYKSAVEG